MGGAEGYDKLWRKIGSTICMSFILMHCGLNETPQFFLAVALIAWGCASYFGWINFFISWLADIEIDSEYWWNFWVENMVIQSSVLLYKHSAANIGFCILWSGLVATGKVLIDLDEDGCVLFWKKDIVSEWWHGSGNALGIWLNSMLP